MVGHDAATAMIRAAESGYLPIVELMLSKGIDPNSQDRARHATALTWAAEGGHSSIVSTLLARGADINVVDDSNRTPLYLACQAGHVKVVDLLLRHGAKVDICDTVGQSPLQVARRHAGVADLVLKEEITLAKTRLSSFPEGYRDVSDLLDGYDPSNIETVLKKTSVLGEASFSKSVVSNNSSISGNSFPTYCVEGAEISTGKWCFEVTRRRGGNGIIQVGFTIKGSPAPDGEINGVGDDEYSWSICGYRAVLFHKAERTKISLPEQDKAGSSILACVDADAGRIFFHWNGSPEPIPHAEFSYDPSLVLVPSVSIGLNGTAEVSLNPRATCNHDLSSMSAELEDIHNAKFVVQNHDADDEKASENLVVNGEGALALHGWKVIMNGGDQWKTERIGRMTTGLDPAYRKTCFVTSFDWCRKAQGMFVVCLFVCLFVSRGILLCALCFSHIYIYECVYIYISFSRCPLPGYPSAGIRYRYLAFSFIHHFFPCDKFFSHLLHDTQVSTSSTLASHRSNWTLPQLLLQKIGIVVATIASLCTT